MVAVEYIPEIKRVYKLYWYNECLYDLLDDDDASKFTIYTCLLSI